MKNKSLVRKLGAYSAAAGAVAMGTAAANAAVYYFDHTAAPLNASVDYWHTPRRTNMAYVTMSGHARYTVDGGGMYSTYDENNNLVVTSPFPTPFGFGGKDSTDCSVLIVYDEWDIGGSWGLKAGPMFETKNGNGLDGWQDGLIRRATQNAAGVTIDAATNWFTDTDGDGLATGGFNSNGSGSWNGWTGDAYIGFFIDRGGGDRNYGWVYVNKNGDRDDMTVKGWAYETDLNTGIVTGVPEPATLSLLGLGAVGLMARRKRA